MIKRLNFLGVLLVFCVACNSASINSEHNAFNLLGKPDTIVDIALVDLSATDLLVIKSYFNKAFLMELNSVFNFNNSTLSKSHQLTTNILLEEFEDEVYYYLVLNNNGKREVIHGSEIIHCHALFGELQEVLNNSFVWTYNGGCGSGQKRTWIEYSFEGEFLNSSDELLWVDKESSTVLFKMLYKNSEIYGLNTARQKVWKAVQLENEETFYESYNWEFSKIDAQTIQGIYNSIENDTVVIKLEK